MATEETLVVLEEKCSSVHLKYLSDDLYSKIVPNLCYRQKLENSQEIETRELQLLHSPETSTRFFPSGMTRYLMYVLKHYGIEYKYIASHGRVIPEDFVPRIVPDLPIRSEFVKPLDQALRLGRGIFLVPMGTGKTNFGMNLAYNLFLLTGKKGLWISSREKAVGVELDEASEKLLSFAPDVILERRTRSWAKKNVELLKEYGFLIIDEVQDVCYGDEYQTIILKGGIPYVYGLTGTLSRGDQATDSTRALVGPVFFKMTVDESADAGYIMKPEVVLHDVFHQVKFNPKEFIRPDCLEKATKAGDFSNLDFLDIPRLAVKLRKEYMFESKSRAAIIADHLSKTCSIGGISMLLFDRIASDQVDLVMANLSESLRATAAILTGETQKSLGDSILEDLKSESGIIKILFTTIGYRSLNIPRLTDVFLIGDKKSEELIDQAMGRLTRHLTKDSVKTRKMIHIYRDHGHPVLASVAKKRLEILSANGLNVVQESTWEFYVAKEANTKARPEV